MNKNWYIFNKDHHQGPYSFEELQASFENNQIDEKTLVWQEGDEASWLPISNYLEAKTIDVEKISEEKAIEKIELIVESPPPIFSEVPNPFEAPSAPIAKEVLPDLPEIEQEEIVQEKVEQEEVEQEEVEQEEVELEEVELEEVELEEVELEEVEIKLEVQEQSQEIEVASDELAQTKELKINKGIPFLGKIALSLMTLTFLLVSSSIFWRDKEVSVRFQNITVNNAKYLNKVLNSKRQEYYIGVALSQKNNIIWGASNKKLNAFVAITLSSMKKKVMSAAPIALNSRGSFVDGIAKFEKLSFVLGDRIAPGHYIFQLRGQKKGFKSALFKILKKIPLIKKISTVKGYDPVIKYRKTFYLGPFSEEEFENKFNIWQSELENKKLKPLQEILESYKTVLSLNSQMRELFEKTITTISRGKDIKRYRLSYSNNISLILQSLIISTYKLYEVEKASNSEHRVLYSNFISTAKEISALAPKIVNATKKVQFLSKGKNKKRKWLLEKFVEEHEIIEDRIKLRINSLNETINQLEI